MLGSLWVLPLLCGLLGAGLSAVDDVVVVVVVDKAIHLPATWTYCLQRSSV